MSLTAPAAALFVAFIATGSAHAQDARRIVIATHVMCREAPDRSAPVAVQYRMGELFIASDSVVSGNDVWYRDAVRSYRGCWIHGSLTTAWDPLETALLAAADRVLARTDQVPFEDYVAVDNLLLQTRTGSHSDTTALELSPLLQLRRLEILERAGAAPGTWGRQVQRDPLKSAWFHANRSVMRYHEPGGRWIVIPEVYWQLFERHEDSPIAEQLAWVYAQQPLWRDDGCDAVCALDHVVLRWARYWSVFPQGSHVVEAMNNAHRVLGFALHEECTGERAAEARQRLGAAVQTLPGVSEMPEKAALMDRLREIDRLCGGAG